MGGEGGGEGGMTSFRFFAEGPDSVSHASSVKPRIFYDVLTPWRVWLFRFELGVLGVGFRKSGLSCQCWGIKCRVQGLSGLGL